MPRKIKENLNKLSDIPCIRISKDGHSPPVDLEIEYSSSPNSSRPFAKCKKKEKKKKASSKIYMEINKTIINKIIFEKKAILEDFCF